MQVYAGVEVYLHTFLTLALDEEWSASHPNRFNLEEITQKRTGQEA
jgi:hypothetical protein